MRICLIFITVLYSQLSFSKTLTVYITGVVPNNGEIRIAVFNSKQGFQDKIYTEGKILVSSMNQLKTVFHGLKYSKYAIAVFQDTNGNKEVDKTFFGYPSELIGFSGINTIGKPNFEDASFLFSATNNEISIKLH